MREGYERANTEQWRMVRSVMFMVASPYLKNKMSITDFFPLPGDPTLEEIKSMKEAEAERMKVDMQKKFDEYFSKGYLNKKVILA